MNSAFVGKLDATEVSTRKNWSFGTELKETPDLKKKKSGKFYTPKSKQNRLYDTPGLTTSIFIF